MSRARGAPGAHAHHSQGADSGTVQICWAARVSCAMLPSPPAIEACAARRQGECGRTTPKLLKGIDIPPVPAIPRRRCSNTRPANVFVSYCSCRLLRLRYSTSSRATWSSSRHRGVRGHRSPRVDVQVQVAPGLPRSTSLVCRTRLSPRRASACARRWSPRVWRCRPPHHGQPRPADLPKEGSHYDLPIALGLMGAIRRHSGGRAFRFTVLVNSAWTAPSPRWRGCCRPRSAQRSWRRSHLSAALRPRSRWASPEMEIIRGCIADSARNIPRRASARPSAAKSARALRSAR